MIGQTISHYKITEKLGGGGMGVVYKAQDTKLKRTVALKFLPPDLTRDPEAKERFIHEAQAASALDHKNICTIYEVGETNDGQLFIAMACYEGETLKARIAPAREQESGEAGGKGQLPIEEALNFADQIAQGLTRAHEAGIVHRDIKPANIIITTRGEVKIVDFGLAKLSGRTLLTKSGTTLGTAAYMSPEQAKGERVDQRTDIWSLGVVLYEMLTGKRPFESEYEQALVYSIINQDPTPIRNLRPDVPEAIEKICRRAMAKEARDRYQNVSEFLTDLSSYRTGTQLSRQTARLPNKKRRILYAGMAATVLAIASVVFFYNTGKGRVFDRVVVLPFHNVSKDSTQEYMADGVTEEVIAKLQQIATLSVPPIRAMIKFKGSSASYADIARELNAKALVDASIQIVNNRVRIFVKLVDPASDRPLWSDTYDGDMEDILDLQSKIAQALVGEVRVKVTPDEALRLAQSRKVDPDVTRFTFLAKHELEYGWNEESFHKAIGLFEKAINRDSTYAPAWAGLGEALWYLAATGWEFVAPADVRGRAVAAVEKALELDPNLADAHKACASIALDGEWDVAKAQRHLERSLELQPGYAAAHAIYGQMLFVTLHRREESRRHLDRARELDPLLPWNDINWVGWSLYQGRLEEALQRGAQARQRDSSNAAFPWLLGFADLLLSKPAQAVPAFETALRLDSPDRPAPMLAPLGLAYGLAGRRNNALKILAEMEQASKTRYISPFCLAVANSGVGRMDEAYRLLDVALEERTPWLVNGTTYDGNCVALRRDPRWKSFTERLRKLVRLPEGTPNPYL